MHTCVQCCADHPHFEEITLTFERAGTAIEVRGVPAYVCRQCGEQYIPGPTAEAVSAATDDIFRAQEKAEGQPGAHHPVFRGLDVIERDDKALATA